MCEAMRLPAAGLAETAALGPKAGKYIPGIYFPPNPQVKSTDMAYGQGLGLVRGAGSGYCAEGSDHPNKNEKHRPL